MSRVAQAAVLALLAVSLSCGGTSTKAAPKSPEDVIRDTERARIRALVANDMDRARPLHADEFTLTAPTGDLFTKATYLGAIGSGRLDYVLWKPISPIRVQITGDRARVTYRSEIGFAGNFGGTTEQAHHDTYERRGGRWQIVRSVTVFDS